ncbi:hypothetical protein FF011L_41630 [Roseimaritima multifibrata]|uniref:Uncharacterized protein n=1 Tax=Roseimaritima multifibrata TaxID=1930274 RepID=A0A517MKG4_9BACT|nr:hypothetical protein FF011L_41630 [Roseimaritima multifibrata]
MGLSIIRLREIHLPQTPFLYMGIGSFAYFVSFAVKHPAPKDERIFLTTAKNANYAKEMRCRRNLAGEPSGQRAGWD